MEINQKSAQIDENTSYSSAFSSHFRTIKALMLRDALSRYGHANLGYFWIIGEPLMLTLGVMILWSIAKISHSSDVGVVPFALTGYTFLTLWRHIAARSIRILHSNRSLYYHRQIKAIDVFFSMVLVEICGVLAAFFVAYIPLWLLGACPTLTDPLNLLVGFFLSAWFASAIGLLLAGLSAFGGLLEHLVGPMMYLSLPLTGAFTLQQWLPQTVQYFLSWSPLVNGVEMYRSGIFTPDVHTSWSFNYLLICCILSTAFGLFVFRAAESYSEPD